MGDLKFVSVDVETANADMASICQIGIAKYVDNSLVDEWVTLIDPEDEFSYINIDIHGISEKTVKGAPKFPNVAPTILQYFEDNIVVSHTQFDRVSIGRAFSKYNLELPDTSWLDSAKVVRRAWPEFARKGYGLSNVCEKIGYSFNHHDALEDAKAAGVVLLEAISITGMGLVAWQKRVRRPIDPNQTAYGSIISRDGNPEGELYGEVLVFTGELEIPRREAAAMAANIGCAVGKGVNKKTTLLVVGDQDLLKLAGKKKSLKHIKAESFIKSGQNIRIIKESDFRELVDNATHDALV